MAFGLIFLIPWLLMTAIPIALCVGVVVRGLTLPKGLRRGTPAVCGRCNHELPRVDAATPMPERCPECGYAYTLGGVLTLGLAKKTRPGMISLILCWSLLALIGTSFVTGIAAALSSASAVSNVQQSFSQTISAVRTDGGTPTAVPGYAVRFSGDVNHQWSGPATGGTLVLSVQPDAGTPISIEVDAVAGSWTNITSGGAGLAFDRVAAETALRDAGIDTTPAWVGHEADRLVEAVAYVRRNPSTASYDVLSNGGHVHSTTHSTTAPPKSTANPGGDGEPDGGFVTTIPASQNYTSTSTGNDFPVALIVTIGLGGLLWIGGIAFVITRRFKMYPEHALRGIGDPAMA